MSKTKAEILIEHEADIVRILKERKRMINFILEQFIVSRYRAESGERQQWK